MQVNIIISLLSLHYSAVWITVYLLRCHVTLRIIKISRHLLVFWLCFVLLPLKGPNFSFKSSWNYKGKSSQVRNNGNFLSAMSKQDDQSVLFHKKPNWVAWHLILWAKSTRGFSCHWRMSGAERRLLFQYLCYNYHRYCLINYWNWWFDQSYLFLIVKNRSPLSKFSIQ